MRAVTLQQLHQDLKGMRKELRELRESLDERRPIADDVAAEIEACRRRPKQQFISHEDVKATFGLA